MQQELDFLDKHIYVYIILHANLKERDLLEVKVVDGRIILKHTMRKENEDCGLEALVIMVMYHQILKIRGIP